MKDETIPTEHGITNYRAAPDGHKTLLLLPSTPHDMRGSAADQHAQLVTTLIFLAETDQWRHRWPPENGSDSGEPTDLVLTWSWGEPEHLHRWAFVDQSGTDEAGI
jgi:hypothetical protein